MSKIANWLIFAGLLAFIVIAAGCKDKASTGKSPSQVIQGAETSGAIPAPPEPVTAARDVKSAAVQEEAASARSEIVNNPAPDFTLPDQNGRQVALSSLKGQWVVLYFYPKDDTPGCTTEATEFTGLGDGFKKMKARILGVSSDSVASHKDFTQKFGLGVDLLSDSDHRVMKAYGAWVDASLGDRVYGRVIRSTVLIDPEGKIRYHWPEVIPQGHAERVSGKLAELQARAK